jgi:parvulin-like peptidyl-prolyl isomerase
MRRCGVIGAVLATLGLGLGPARAEIIDRVVAVVDGAPITQSDVAAAMRLGLVRVGTAPDRTSATVDALIDRRLMLAEVERYAPPDPAEAEVDRKLAEIRAAVGAEFDAVLAQTGTVLERLRRQVRDDLRIEAYIQQRFGTVLPSEDQILQYYRQHPEEFPQRAFDDAHDAARAALLAERRAAVVEEWLSGLRRRANINVLPKPAASYQLPALSFQFSVSSFQFPVSSFQFPVLFLGTGYWELAT